MVLTETDLALGVIFLVLLIDMVGVQKAKLKGALAAFMLCFVAACSSGGKLDLPVDTPRTIGAESDNIRDHMRLVAAFGGEYDHPAARRMLEDIVKRLVRASDTPDRSYQVTILNSPIANAFALPSGRIYVTRGLLAVANDTAEIAAVLSHEMAHVTLNHSEARSELVARSSLMNRVNREVLSDHASERLMQEKSKNTIASFSRGQEIEADAAGIRTLAAAGFDPYGAVRFLSNLGRFGGTGDKSSPHMLATHPSTVERIRRAQAEARKLSDARSYEGDRASYLQAINGIAYGDNPSEGLVRGRRFIHARFGVSFEAPEGFSLENTAQAVLGVSSNGSYRLLFDAVENRTGQALEQVLRTSWNEPIEPESIQAITVNNLSATIGSSHSAEWNFRLSAIQIGSAVFRLIVAAPNEVDGLDRIFRQTLNSLRQVTSEEARRITPLHIGLVEASAGDTLETIASRMIVSDRPIERFLILNGLTSNAVLTVGEKYKLIMD